MTQQSEKVVAYVLLGRGIVQAQAIFLSPDSLIQRIQRQYPGAKVEMKQEQARVRGSGTRYTRHYIEVSGVKSYVAGLGEFTGTHNHEFELVEIADPEHWGRP